MPLEGTRRVVLAPYSRTPRALLEAFELSALASLLVVAAADEGVDRAVDGGLGRGRG